MQETWVPSLGWGDPLEEGMATHSSILAWRIPQTEEPGGWEPMGSQRAGHDWSDLAHTHQRRHPEEGVLLLQGSGKETHASSPLLRCLCVKPQHWLQSLVWSQEVVCLQRGQAQIAEVMSCSQHLKYTLRQKAAIVTQVQVCCVLSMCLSLSSWAVAFFTWPETLIWCLGCIRCIMQWPRSYFTWLTSVCIIRRQFLSIVQMHFYCIFF